MHNIIKYEGVPITGHETDLSEEKRKEQVELEQRGLEVLSTRGLKKKGEELRNQIADQMWQDYQ